MTDVTDDRPHSRACGMHPHPHGRLCHSNCPTCNGLGGEPTSQAQVDADKVQQRRVSELQAENEQLRARAARAEAELAGIKSALETLFTATWPPRYVVGVDPAADPSDMSPGLIMQMGDADPAAPICSISPLCEASVHLLACPKHASH